MALYRAPAFIEFLAGLTGRAAAAVPRGDPHSCALYFYTEPGDHIGFHFDTSYYRGARYTVLLGLIERSSSRLVCQLFKNDPGPPPGRAAAGHAPGHADRCSTATSSGTPSRRCGDGEERVSLTLEYVTDPSMHPAKRLFSNLKDAFAYFGFRSGVPPRPPRRVAGGQERRADQDEGPRQPVGVGADGHDEHEAGQQGRPEESHGRRTATAST